MSLDAGRVGVRADQVDVHGRVTSPSFLNELLEDLPEWTDMPVWVNGTEELLPSDNSVPVTSPILADIAYPDIRRDNQYFTYRESPTPVDGLAKIKSIKGNTLVWNQLTEHGNFDVTTGWRTESVESFTVSNNEGTFTPTARNGRLFRRLSLSASHKYLLTMWLKCASAKTLQLYTTDSVNFTLTENVNVTTLYNRFSAIFTLPSTIGANIDFGVRDPSDSDFLAINVKSFMLVDLTKMGLDSITNPAEFASLFPLPYYAYNAGTLLSFNGTGLKTVGKNLFNGIYNNLAFANTVAQDSSYRGYTLNVSALKGKQITVSRADTTTNNRFRASFFSVEPVANTPFERDLNSGDQYYTYDSQLSFTLTVPNGANYLLLYISNNETVANDLMIEIGSAVSDYESYTSNTTNLPVLTYFPTGMKSVGTVYDELTPTKAITRIGAVDLGSLTWTFLSASSWNCYYAPISDKANGNINFINAKYPIGDIHGTTNDKVSYGNANNKNIYIRDTSIADAQALKDSLQGVYLYYELATPVELPTLSLGD